MTNIYNLVEYTAGDFVSEKDYKKELKDKLIKYRQTLNLSKKITFGIEIEYENALLDKISYALEEEKMFDRNICGWHNKTELDITEYNECGEEINGEITSPRLIDEKRTWISLERVLDLIKYNGGIITEKCGGHVNIGAHILGENIEYWKNFFLLWKLYYKEIYLFSTGEFANIRSNVKNCSKPINRGISVDDILRINSFEDFNFRVFDKCHDIYIPIRVLEKVQDGNRIEFRIPNGTLNPTIWQNYINFFSKFVIACTKDLDSDKIIYDINHKNSNPIDLANYVFKSEIDKEMFLIQSLKTNKVYKRQLPSHLSYE